MTAYLAITKKCYLYSTISKEATGNFLMCYALRFFYLAIQILIN